MVIDIDEKHNKGGIRTKSLFKESKHNLPLISVVTIVYNAVGVLQDTIMSVLMQTYSNIEYIIVDGGSIDGSLGIIKENQEKIDFWISEKDNGIHDAMNKGIDLASGEWLIFMNAGDSFYEENTIEQVVNTLKRDKDIDVLYGDVMLQSEYEKNIYKKSDHTKLQTLDSHNTICHQSAFVRLDVLKCLKFNNLKYSMDLEFWTRCFQNNLKFRHIDLVVSNYEVGGVSSNPQTALDVMIEHRIVKMLWLRKYSSKLLIGLLKDLCKLKIKLFLNNKLGARRYFKLKKLLGKNQY